MPPAGADGPAARSWTRLLRWAFFFSVAAFAWLRFSDNTADNDLWGHVLYGQRMLTLRQLESTDVLSWTAAGQRWINHETAAEIVLGLVHHAAGSTGLWVFMMGMAAATVSGACRDGTGGRTRIVVTMALFAASINFIATGYAVRPQLFTMLAFVALLAGLRRFLAGRTRWGWLLPPLFAAWVNFHGGYLAGWLVLLLALAAGAIAQIRRPGRPAAVPPVTAGTPGLAQRLMLALACTAALGVNPEGFHLFVWTLQTVQLPRPAITEWQPMPLSFGALPFHFVVLVSAGAWSFSRRVRPWWQPAVLAALALLAVLQQRHAPLFGLANLMFTPEHLDDTIGRFARHVAGLTSAFRRTAVQIAAAVALLASGVAAGTASVLPPRVSPFAIEVPADVYPVAAIQFMRAHALEGNTLTFFDWGQQVLWELPDNPVSFDGRLDTVYSRELMEAHWRLYAGEPPGPSLDFGRAAVALLPTGSGGIDLLRRHGWQLAYRDPLAGVLVRRAAEFPRLQGLRLPVLEGPAAVRGRVRFPDEMPRLATAQRPR